jgi:SAM-dependent methyltransferase
MATKYLRSDRFSNEQKKAQFLNSIFVLDDKKTVLELGSGSGYLTEELLKTKARIICVDRREPKILLPEFIKVDFFRDLIPVENVDVVFILHPYLGEEWWNFESFLQNISKTMKVGAKFVLDLNYYNSVPFGYVEEFDTNQGDHILTSFYIRKSGAYVGHMTKTYPDGKVVEYDTLTRIFEKDELEKVVQMQGFKLTNTYLNFEPIEFKGNWIDLPERSRLCVLLEKIV